MILISMQYVRLEAYTYVVLEYVFSFLAPWSGTPPHQKKPT